MKLCLLFILSNLLINPKAYSADISEIPPNCKLVLATAVEQIQEKDAARYERMTEWVEPVTVPDYPQFSHNGGAVTWYIDKQERLTNTDMEGIGIEDFAPNENGSRILPTLVIHFKKDRYKMVNHFFMANVSQIIVFAINGIVLATPEIGYPKGIGIPQVSSDGRIQISGIGENLEQLAKRFRRAGVDISEIHVTKIALKNHDSTHR